MITVFVVMFGEQLVKMIVVMIFIISNPIFDIDGRHLSWCKCNYIYRLPLYTVFCIVGDGVPTMDSNGVHMRKNTCV